MPDLITGDAIILAGFLAQSTREIPQTAGILIRAEPVDISRKLHKITRLKLAISDFRINLRRLTS